MGNWLRSARDFCVLCGNPEASENECAYGLPNLLEGGEGGVPSEIFSKGGTPPSTRNVPFVGSVLSMIVLRMYLAPTTRSLLPKSIFSLPSEMILMFIIIISFSIYSSSRSNREQEMKTRNGVIDESESD